MEAYVGLDAHSKRSVFVIANAAGEVIGRGDVPTTPAGLATLRTEHQLAAGTPVALESGTVAFFVARQLAALDLAPVVIDAHEVRLKAYRPQHKSDRRDAQELCEGLRRGTYRTRIHVPPPTIAALREILSRRRHFVRMQTAEVLAAKRLLRAEGLGHLSRCLRSDVGWTKLHATLTAHPQLAGYIDLHHAVWRAAHTQVLALDDQLAPTAAPCGDALRRCRRSPASGRSSHSPRSRSSPTPRAFRPPSTPRVTRGSSPKPTSRETRIARATSPERARLSCGPCSCRRLTQRDGKAAR
jgi:hypothetical protein